MTIRLKKNATIKQINAALNKIKTAERSYDLTRFAGKIKWEQDAVTYQRELRQD